MKDKAGHAKASITMLTGGTTQFSAEFIKSITTKILNPQKLWRDRCWVCSCFERHKEEEEKEIRRGWWEGGMGWQLSGEHTCWGLQAGGVTNGGLVWRFCMQKKRKKKRKLMPIQLPVWHLVRYASLWLKICTGKTLHQTYQLDFFIKMNIFLTM